MRSPFSSQFNSAEALLYVSSQQWGLSHQKQFPCKLSQFEKQNVIIPFSPASWKGGQESHFIEIPFSKYFSCFPFGSRNPILSKSHLVAKVLYSTFPMKWNSIFVRRVKKTVFRFPFYRISILSRMYCTVHSMRGVKSWISRTEHYSANFPGIRWSDCARPRRESSAIIESVPIPDSECNKSGLLLHWSTVIWSHPFFGLE